MKNFSRLLSLVGLAILVASPTYAMSEILDPTTQFKCSPEAVGCSGLFAPHVNDGSQMALLTNGESSLAARLKSLREAKKSILIQALIFKGDEAGVYISNILKERKHEGLDVRVIVDGIANPEPTSQMMYFDLKSHGVEVVGFEAGYLQWVHEVSLSDPEQPNKRFHDKIWVIDGETSDGSAILGGLNIANEYFRLGEKAKGRWRDQDMIVKGPIVSDIHATFERNFTKMRADRLEIFNTDAYWKLWNKGLRCVFKLFPCITDPSGAPRVEMPQDKEILEELREAENNSKPIHYRNADMRFFQSRPRLGETFVHETYLKLIASAREEILIANAYFLPPPDVIEALQQAVARGVRLKLLTNSEETNDVPGMTPGTRHLYGALLEAAPRKSGAVKIYEWDGPHHNEGTLHAKFAVFDRKVGLIGSYNLDYRSRFLNSETAVVFEDDYFAKKLANHYLARDLRKSRRIFRNEAALYFDPTKIGDQIKLMMAETFKGVL